jgi:KDO2-lipid IV(A) lauroyltransferase
VTTPRTPLPTLSQDAARARFRRLFGPLHITGIFWVHYIATAARLPLWLLRPVTWCSVAFMFPLLPGRRRVVVTNLEGPLGPCGFWARQQRVWRTFQAHAWHLVERFRCLDPRHQPTIEVDGAEVFERIRASDHGWLIVTAHLGSWEVGSALSLLEACDDRRIHVVREREDHAATQRFIEARVATAPARRAVIHYLDGEPDLGVVLLKALRGADVVSLAGDRPRHPNSGIEVTLFGRPVAVPNGPPALARAAGVPIVPVFLFLIRPGHHRVVARPPIQVARTVDKRADLRAAAQRIAGEIEWAIRQAPHDWARWEVVWRDA